jgi:hypothetical protein
MKQIDRRALTRALLFGAAAAGLGLGPARRRRCRSTTAFRAPSTIGSRRLRPWSSPRVRAGALVAASGAAGGIEAAASAVGSGCEL